MSQEIESLHQEFQQGRPAALLDALALCRIGATSVPAWIIDALLVKREVIAVALNPPPQIINPDGVDMGSWGGLDDARGVEVVPAGTGSKVVAGRRRQEELRKTYKDTQDALVIATYRRVCASGGTRARAITMTHQELLRQGTNLSRSQVARILQATHKRAR